MNHDDYRSTAAVAEALGVSVSTVKRWVDSGLLNAHRTAGGHRKLLLAEVLAFCRDTGLELKDRTVLNARAPRLAVPPYARLQTELRQALVSADGVQVRDLLRGLVDAGIAVAEIADRLIMPVMHAIGHCWQTKQIDVWEEHRATQMLAASLYGIESLLQKRIHRKQPLALGAAPEGDPYILPTLLAAMSLLDQGWRATNIGPNTPADSIIHAAKRLKPKLIWISVSHLACEEQFLLEYHRLFDVMHSLRIPVAIGGQALHPDLRSAMRYTTFGDGFHHLTAFAATLHPPPRRPARGRPPKKQS